jgi:hypothetical protein
VTDICAKPAPRDIRLAAALIIHHRSGDAAGLHEIVGMTAESDRASALLLSLLDLHRLFIVQTRTATGVNYVATIVWDIIDDPLTDDPVTVDAHRAAQIIDAHGRGSFDDINAVLAEVRAENRGTQTLLGLLNIYRIALPELSSSAGRAWLDCCVTTALAEEGTP